MEFNIFKVTERYSIPFGTNIVPILLIKMRKVLEHTFGGYLPPIKRGQFLLYFYLSRAICFRMNGFWYNFTHFVTMLIFLHIFHNLFSILNYVNICPLSHFRNTVYTLCKLFFMYVNWIVTCSNASCFYLFVISQQEFGT